MIYLDYNATTPVAPEVTKEMESVLRDNFGNPSSLHSLGKKARAAVEQARGHVAGLLGCSSEEIVFTSCGSESNNQVIKGIAELLGDRGRHIVTSSIEHPAVLEPCRWLESKGFEVTYLPVGSYGQVSLDSVKNALRPDTILVTIMHANSEVGALQSISEIARIVHSKDILLHTDAAQSVGKIPTLVDELGVDFLSIAGHKLHAPKGVGALYVRSGLQLPSLIHGSGHEGGMRAGTENVAGIAGLGKACVLSKKYIQEGGESIIRSLRDRLFESLQNSIGGIKLNGHPEQRLPNTLSLCFEGIDSSLLLEKLPELAASTRSACHSSCETPSTVLTAMGLSPEQAFSVVRFSIGRYTTEDEIDQAAEWIAEIVKKQHLLSPMNGRNVQ